MPHTEAVSEVSVERQPRAEEARIGDLKKSVTALKRKISAEERKLVKYREAFNSLDATAEEVSASFYNRLQDTVDELAQSVFTACGTAGYPTQVKCLIRDILFQALDELRVDPKVEPPAWLHLDPPEPESLTRITKSGDERSNETSRTVDKDSEIEGQESEDPSEGEEEPFDDFFEEFEKQAREEGERARRILRGESISMTEESQRALRAIYIRLVTAVHPDLATDDDDRIVRTQLAARINTAYKNGQMTVLMEIEAELSYQARVKSDLSSLRYHLDEIKELESTQQLLLQQLSRLRADMKYLKKSPLGKKHKTLEKAFKQGKLTKQQALDDANTLAARYDELSKKLTVSLRDRKKVRHLKDWIFTEFIARYRFEI